MRGGDPIGQIDLVIPPGMFDRRANAVTPSAFILVAGRGKGRTGKLFAVKPIGAFLRAVHAFGQGTGQGFGFEIIAKAGHVSIVQCRNPNRAGQPRMGALIGHGPVLLRIALGRWY